MLLLCGVLGAPVFAGEPYRPSDPDTILERLPAADERDALAPFRRTLEKQPDNLRLATTLARRYIELARRESDPRFLGYAEAALSAWNEDAPASVLVLRATIAQSRHDFETSLGMLERALAEQPDNAQARLTRAHVLLARGRPRDALRDCRHLTGRVGPLVAITCASSAQARSGKLSEAHTRLVRALQQATDAKPSIRAWALTELGEQSERLGDPAAAEAHFRAALDVTPGKPYRLAAYADLLLEQGREREVVELLRSRSQADALLLRLALAGDGEDGRRWNRMLQARFAAADRRGEASHLRERARYTLDGRHEPETALELARANWVKQREPADLRLLLRAATATDRPDAARPALAWIEEYDFQDERLTPLLKRLQAGER